MGVAMSMTARYARAGSQAFRLVADARGASKAAGLLLRGSPFALGWFAGWLTTEFPPHVVTGHALSRVSAPSIGRIGASWAGQRAEQTLTAALEASFGPDYADLVSHPACEESECAPRGGLLHRPGPHARYAAQTSDISYGPGGRDNLLDIWRRHDLAPGRRAPVLIQVPGGAWAVNGKRGQAYTLMSRMVELGWICVSIDYSKSPRSTFPAHLIDVKRAIAWVRENIADYGGDPGFIAITGGSAGGHLASLAALTPNDPRFQPGFEHADTTVQAAVPYYGVYDFTNAEVMHELMLPFLEQFVMRARYAETPERFAAASPINYVHDEAPPFFVLHGERDELVPCTQARTFCAAMRDAGAPLVAYAELANAHHAFDILSTARSRLAAKAVADFLGIVYGRRAIALLDSWPLSATSAS
ncbi:MAG: alpha/beta hydrolase [Actinomycetota bacterium]|uniref:Alpha/beta hydrolase n=1 Tax=Mycobacterium lentiflavum TaxID=141349 RepID=A0ABY3UV62_MYCLN|nr:alpha/beta hydrolase [Mycobacterium lentiflavum]MEE3065578.1 alpha/beta hydrolase [Actinomycetota bacterium]ULP41021.1 alpha/beta hydrolase [Mycobacterium lentiflavum]